MAADRPATALLDIIEGFNGRWRCLSNFSRNPVFWEGVLYPTSEAAFQAGKTLDPVLRRAFAEALTPEAAKKLGQEVALRPDWDVFWRHAVMRDVLAAKFTDPELATLLMSTGTALLIESNRWCDNTWGDCVCPKHRAKPGRNLLGLALMDLRAVLAPPPTGLWTRVMCTGHRPAGIPPQARRWVREELLRVARKLAAEHGTQIAISGLAVGSDLWWAQAAHEAGLRVWGYSPCDDQDARWTEDWKAQRRDVVKFASRVASLSERYTPAVLSERNTWMIRDAAAVVAVLDPRRTTGGTAAALRRIGEEMPVIKIDVIRQHTTIAVPGVDVLAAAET